MKNYYQILSIKNNATQDDIKKAYRTLVLKYHPDRNAGNNLYTDLFTEVKEAYDTLSNPILKQEYDIRHHLYFDKLNEETSTSSPEQEEVKIHSKIGFQEYIRIKIKSIKNWISDWLQKQWTIIKNHKFKSIAILVLISLPIIAYFVNSYTGLFTILGIYFLTGMFISTISSIRDPSPNTSVGGLLIGIFGAPIGAIYLSYQVILFFNPNMSNNPNPSIQKNPNLTTKVENNKWYKNQLNNGESPLDSCFGGGIYSQNAWIEFINSNETDAIICLVRVEDDKIIRNNYIRANATFKVNKIPTGIYYIKVYYGNDWNPDKKNFCGIEGAFEKNVSFSKSDNIGDQIKIENTINHYTVGTITLYAVANGNMTTKAIDEKSFFNN